MGSVRDRLPGGGLVVFYWSGHGELDGGLRLITADDDEVADGVGFAEVVRPVARSGGHQLLFIVDVCHAGAAIPVAAVVDELLRNVPPAEGAVWVGVLVSCLDVETARDGEFGKVLRRVLAEGPSDAEIAWSSRSEFITGEQLGYAVLREWPEDAGQSVDFQRRGTQLAVIPNPLYQAGGGSGADCGASVVGGSGWGQ